VNSASGAAAAERIRLVAKLDVRRSEPGAARYAYKWQSVWENPTTHHTTRALSVRLAGHRDV